MRQIVAVTTLILGVASVAAHADVYRWVDSEGRVQYSDRWVPGAVLIKTSRGRVDPEAAAALRTLEQNKLATSNDTTAARQSQQAASQAVRQDVAKARDEQCKQATERYEKSIQARRLYRPGKQGEREYLTDAEADEARLQARVEMQNACGNPAK